MQSARSILLASFPLLAILPSVSASAQKPRELVGDASLRDQFDLNAMRLNNGVYKVPLRGGGHAVLTLHEKIQAAAEHTLQRAKAPLGAIVVTRVDGRILALAGRRTLQPAREKDFALPLSVWAPAASIFKIITSAALLSSGVKPTSTVCYHGGVRSIERSHLVDNKRRDTTCAGLSAGLAKSQNAIFAKLAYRHLTQKKLERFAKLFGFGTPSQFALKSETSRCTIPADAFERAKVAAGFWQSELSPLGGAQIAGIIANEGKLAVPQIVNHIVKDGRALYIKKVPAKRTIDPQVARQIGKMMERATQRGGTAFRGFHNRRGRYMLGKVRVAGKTGSLSQKQTLYLGYSWFVGYAPADNPQYVISVILGNPMKWHLKASTAARLVLQEALQLLRAERSHKRQHP